MNEKKNDLKQIRDNWLYSKRNAAYELTRQNKLAYRQPSTCFEIELFLDSR